jgi:hypothetical protein
MSKFSFLGSSLGLQISLPALLLALTLGGTAHAGQFLPLTVQRRIDQSDLVVHGTVRHLDARMETNVLGDRYIVTRATVEVQDVVKGSHFPQFVEVDMIGGTINKGSSSERTMQSSALPVLPQENEEVVLMVNQRPDGVGQLNLRGQGYFKVNSSTHQVGATKYSVDDLKAMTKGGAK